MSKTYYRRSQPDSHDIGTAHRVLGPVGKHDLPMVPTVHRVLGRGSWDKRRRPTAMTYAERVNSWLDR